MSIGIRVTDESSYLHFSMMRRRAEPCANRADTAHRTAVAVWGGLDITLSLQHLHELAGVAFHLQENQAL